MGGAVWYAVVWCGLVLQHLYFMLDQHEFSLFNFFIRYLVAMFEAGNEGGNGSQPSYSNGSISGSQPSYSNGSISGSQPSYSNGTNRYETNVTVLQSKACEVLMMKLRNKDTNCKDFNFYADRIMRILAEEAIARLPCVHAGKVETPCGTSHGLVEDPISLCVVSIPRSGDILQEAVRQIRPGIGIGKIFIQRDENRDDKRPILYYVKLPKNIADCFVVLVDPMLATAGSAKRAISVLIDNKVKEENIMFINLICCPEGLANLKEAYPNVKVFTCAIDGELNDDKFIVPGLGDYGDRYYGTE